MFIECPLYVMHYKLLIKLSDLGVSPTRIKATQGEI